MPLPLTVLPSAGVRRGSGSGAAAAVVHAEVLEALEVARCHPAEPGLLHNRVIAEVARLERHCPFAGIGIVLVHPPRGHDDGAAPIQPLRLGRAQVAEAIAQIAAGAEDAGIDGVALEPLRGLQPRRITVNRRHAQDASTPHPDFVPNASTFPPEPHPVPACPSIVYGTKAPEVEGVAHGVVHKDQGLLGDGGEGAALQRRW